MPNPAAASPSAAEHRPQTQVRAILRNLTAKTMTYFARHEVAHLRAMSEHLLDMAQNVSSKGSTDAYQYRSISFLLDKQAAVPSSYYQDALKDALQASVRLALEPEAPPASTRGIMDPDDGIDGMSLSLIDESEMDQLLSVDQVSQRFNSHYDARLNALNQRIGMLITGQASGLTGNPFRPEVLIRALMTGWKNSGFDEPICKDLLHSLVPQHAIDLGPLYDDLTATLTQSGVKVKTAHRIRKAADTEPGGLSGTSGFSTTSDFGGGPSSQSMSGFNDTGPMNDFEEVELEMARQSQRAGQSSAHGRLAPLGQGLAAQARQFLNRLGFGGAHTEPAVEVMQAPADPTLLGYLGGLQADAGAAFVDSGGLVENGSHNVLRRMREEDAIQQATEIDRGTVDALAEVFDYVFADAAIPPQLKVIIGRLQIPVLKAAMIDREFFHSAEHPARKLIDALAHAAMTWNADKGEDDPLYQQIETTVQRALTEFEDDLSLFGELLLEFEEFARVAEQSAEQHIDPVAQEQKADEAENMALAHADEIIHGRINAVPAATPLAPLLLPFLTGPWRDVLAKAWREVRGKPEGWNEALSTADKLIWSTQPQQPVLVERRQRAPDLSPHPQERRQLMRVLPDLVRKLETGLDAINWVGRPRAEFMHGLMELHMQVIRTTPPSPEELAQRERESKAAEAALLALHQRRVQAQQLAAQDEFEERAKTLVRGMWFDYLNEHGDLIRCRLSWVSPKRTRMLFTNREGFDAFVHSEREVAELLREARLIELDQTPIVGRALDQILAS